MNPVQLGQELDRQYRAACAQLQQESPWFGAFALDKGNRTVSYKVGEHRHPDAFILDWRHPLAAAFYEGTPGEEFEFEAKHYQSSTGLLTYLARVRAQARALVHAELRDADGTHVLVSDGEQLVPEAALTRATATAGTLPDIRALLTPQQYRLITASHTKPVIIQGRAGSGKTTVALYRVSRLTFAAEDDPTARPVDPSRVLIVMFNAALRSFVQTSLEPLKLAQAELATFHHWAYESVKRAYNGTLDINPDTKALPGHETASRLKKQLGMLRALDAFVAEQTRGAAEWLDKRLAPYNAAAIAARFRTMDAPVARRFITLREEALRQRNASVGNAQARWENIYQVLRQGVTRITLYKEELLRFLTSTSLLARHLEGASLDDLRALADFQRAVQSEGGANGKPGPRVTFDDLALLLRLIQLKHGGLADAAREEEVFVYAHLVVDEAQDFGALELRVLLSAVRSRTGVTIVGDHNQKIVPAAEFMGWDALARELGLDGADVTKLKLAHRATAPIMALARTLEDADGDAPADDNEGVAGRPGPLPERIVADTEASLREAVVEGLRQSLAEAPRGHHCVVCPWPKHAKAVLAWLAPALGLPEGAVRLGYNMGFVFEPGVTVTNAQQVKGLEFDSVTVIDPTAAHYPDNDVGRRSLYTVLTRAKDRLRLVSTQATTGLLDAAIARGLLAEVRVGALAPVAFTPEEDDPF